MPAAGPPFRIYVLDHIMSVADLTVAGKPEPGRAWSEIPCASRKAYGCGENIQEAVQGLVLYARLGDGPHLNSALAIRMSEGARRRFESELDPDYYRRRDAELPSDLIARARVEMAEVHGVTVIRLFFTRPAGSFYQQPLIHYYLVYDAIGRSLSMFQIQPDPSCKGVYGGLCTLKPIVPKRTDGSDDYKLLLLGCEDEEEDRFLGYYEDEDEEEDRFLGYYEDEDDRKEDRSSSRKDDVLWVGSLSSSSDGGTGVPSKLKTMDFPHGLIHKPFEVDAAFSCQGKAFWGDLKQGLLYCDLQTSDFGFVKLPREYKVDVESRDESPQPITNTRTMGCVGDAIWFVCIDTPSHYTNAVVCIWELVLPMPGEQWKGKGRLKVKGKGPQWKEVVEEVPAKVLWELPSFKEAGLPAAPFQYPILTPHGALCFVLVDCTSFPLRPPFVEHFCIFDMRYKRLLWHGLVHDYQIFETVIMYPSSSFLDTVLFRIGEP